MNMDPCSSISVLLQTAPQHIILLSPGRTPERSNSSLLTVMRAQAQTWGRYTTHYAEEHAVQAAVRHARGELMNHTAQRWVMENSPSWNMQTCRLTLSWHWHRPAVTPLPGVSAPAGLRPSPLAPLFAAAQPSLCPVSAGKAGQYSLRQVHIRRMDWIWNPRKPLNSGCMSSCCRRFRFWWHCKLLFAAIKFIRGCPELTCCWICPLAACTTICSPVVVVAVVYCSMACYRRGPHLRQKTNSINSC